MKFRPSSDKYQSSRTNRRFKPSLDKYQSSRTDEVLNLV